MSNWGPIDYVLIEWPGRQPRGEAAPALVDLIDRGIVRVLDLLFIAKAEDGSAAGVEIKDSGEHAEELKLFEGASSGLLSEEDLVEASLALEPETSAALLVYENRWAAPFAAAVRRSGGQLVANGRIPVQSWSSRRWRRLRRPATWLRRRPQLERSELMPGLLRGVARTAVVAGTATSVSNRVSRRQAERWASQEERSAAQQAPSPAAARRG